MKIQTLLIGFNRCRAAVRGAGLIAPLLLGMGWMQPASAGCLDVPGLKVPSTDPGKPQSRFGSARIIKVDFKEYGDDEDRHDAPIVGLWAFKYTSEGNMETLGIPDGAPIDSGNTTWYADGNEITYSGARNPTVGASAAACGSEPASIPTCSTTSVCPGTRWLPRPAPPPIRGRPAPVTRVVDRERPAARRSSSNTSLCRPTTKAIPGHSASTNCCRTERLPRCPLPSREQ